MSEKKQEVPSYAFLQSSCIEIKVSLKKEPIKLDSPLEAYACMGKLRKAYGLPCESAHEELKEDIKDLKQMIENKECPSERIEKIGRILFNFEGSCHRESRHLEIMEYAYQTEPIN